MSVEKKRRTCSSLLVRSWFPTDSIAALTRLFYAAYAPLGSMGFNYTAVDQSEDVTRSRIACGDCLVAMDGERLVGTVTVYPPGGSVGCDWYERSNVIAIGQLAVLPQYQGQGIGDFLLREAEERALSAGGTDIALDTAERADHLVGWYQRRGFRIVDRVRWGGKSYRSVILSKPLG